MSLEFLKFKNIYYHIKNTLIRPYNLFAFFILNTNFSTHLNITNNKL